MRPMLSFTSAIVDNTSQKYDPLKQLLIDSVSPTRRSAPNKACMQATVQNISVVKCSTCNNSFHVTMRKFSVVLLIALISSVLAEDAPPVKLDLYYETLCRQCQDYFVEQLYPTFQELEDIMDVHLYPFGNAFYTETEDGWSFTCQHGPNECRANMIHACAQKYIADISVEMDFVNCFLSSTYPPNAGPDCAAEVDVDYTPIDQCVNSVEGEEVLHAVAVQQESLDPVPYFVPWILIDDTFSESQVAACQLDTKKVVCDHYTGPTPPECEAVTEAYQDI